MNVFKILTKAAMRMIHLNRQIMRMLSALNGEQYR
jgi:hypothetical protein